MAPQRCLVLWRVSVRRLEDTNPRTLHAVFVVLLLLYGFTSCCLIEEYHYTQPYVDIMRLHLQESKGHFHLTTEKRNKKVDMLSIGSKDRLEYLQTQRRVLGPHVRNFVGVTEDDDDIQSCWGLSNETAKAVCDYCRQESFQARMSQYLGGAPVTIDDQRHRRFVKYEYLLRVHANPAGWLCAQKRPMTALYRYLKDNRDLPDYLFIVDDDTFVHVPRVVHGLEEFHANAPAVAGCLTHFPAKALPMPWGGYGTFLRKSLLQQLLVPIFCRPVTNPSQQGFGSHQHDHTCQLLHLNRVGERAYFEEGMSLLDLMYAYMTHHPYKSHAGEPLNPFCMHSDWVWQFFFNDYLTDEIAPYLESEFHFQVPHSVTAGHTGQCRNVGTRCMGSEAHICHNIHPSEMRILASSLPS